MSKEITIQASDGGSFQAYLATPNADLAPGVVMIQEIFGVNETMRGLADGYAAAGYLAIVPDLFWRQEAGVQLSDQKEADWKRAFELYQGFDEDKGTEDLIATLNTLRLMENCLGRVGTVGFCLGGKLAYLMATRSDADCNVGYYGVGIEKNLDEAETIT
ncbi:MAG: dienelactone hydrolase family protein, partial [Kamptonema sp. SIO4C4]|nr:dienelactone hydrolase family protein [Kamptonema sp. SIO4C4]